MCCVYVCRYILYNFIVYTILYVWACECITYYMVCFVCMACEYVGYVLCAYVYVLCMCICIACIYCMFYVLYMYCMFYVCALYCMCVRMYMFYTCA